MARRSKKPQLKIGRQKNIWLWFGFPMTTARKQTILENLLYELHVNDLINADFRLKVNQAKIHQVIVRHIRELPQPFQERYAQKPDETVLRFRNLITQKKRAYKPPVRRTLSPDTRSSNFRDEVIHVYPSDAPEDKQHVLQFLMNALSRQSPETVAQYQGWVPQSHISYSKLLQLLHLLMKFDSSTQHLVYKTVGDRGLERDEAIWNETSLNLAIVLMQLHSRPLEFYVRNGPRVEISEPNSMPVSPRQGASPARSNSEAESSLPDYESSLPDYVSSVHEEATGDDDYVPPSHSAPTDPHSQVTAGRSNTTGSKTIPGYASAKSPSVGGEGLMPLPPTASATPSVGSPGSAGASGNASPSPPPDAPVGSNGYLSSDPDDEDEKVLNTVQVPRVYNWWNTEIVPTWNHPAYPPKPELGEMVGLVRHDITKLEIDVIVTGVGPVRGQGGLDGAVHAQAGPELLQECQQLGDCQPGQAQVTEAYNLPARKVMHILTPTYDEADTEASRARLRQCYRLCLETAIQHGLRSIALPAFGTGSGGFPPERAANVALESLRLLLDDINIRMHFYLITFCNIREEDALMYKLLLGNYFSIRSPDSPTPSP